MLTVDSLLWVGLTLAMYLIALQVFKACKQSPLAHPLVISILLLLPVLGALSVSVEQYQHRVMLLNWLLGPATVALAVPLCNQLGNIKQIGWRLLPTILVGGLSAPVLAWILLYWQDVELAIQLSVLTKSITTPLAIDVTAELGGYPSLAAIFVVATGIICVLISPLVFRLLKLRLDQQRGLVLGTIGHAIGTAQGFMKSEKSGAFATTALCINGILTALILPILFIFLD